MLKYFLITFLLIFFTNAASAKQIKIISDKLEIIRTKNISIFSGNVYAVEESLEIWSEKLTINSNKDETKIREISAHCNVKIVR